MKINGETFKLQTPVQAGSIVGKHPGHVLLDSEAVRHYGVRAKPLEPHQELKPKRLYFLVALPKFPEERGVRRVRSGIHMSAKDRLESLMLARRSASDLSIVKPVSIVEEEKIGNLENGGGVRVRMRLRREEVERLMAESKDGGDVVEKIVGLCMAGGGEAEQNVDRESANRGPKLREEFNFKNPNVRPSSCRSASGFCQSTKEISVILWILSSVDVIFCQSTKRICVLATSD